ncbi:MAG: hypothetical protein Tsb0017_27320 [Geothermobacteraceae bacterium]
MAGEDQKGEPGGQKDPHPQKVKTQNKLEATLFKHPVLRGRQLKPMTAEKLERKDCLDVTKRLPFGHLRTANDFLKLLGDDRDG